MAGTYKYSDIEYNPMTVGWGDRIWDKYPDLKDVPLLSGLVVGASDVFAEEVIDEIVRFVILFVDRFSPFRKERNFDTRKKKIYEVIEDFSPAARDNIDKNKHSFQQILSAYFILTNDIEYETWHSLKFSIHEDNEYLRTPYQNSPDAEKVIARKKDIKSAILDNIKRLKEIEKTLFPDKETKRLIAQENSKKSLSNYAEKYATPIDVSGE